MEKLIAKHCAPALAGIKPANIVTCHRSDAVDIYAEVDRLNGQLNHKDIYLRVVCGCADRAIIMVYRKTILEKHLGERCNKAFLANYGYSSEDGLEGYLKKLSSRLKQDGFPHEIGVFLGYPLHDIYCFINHRDEGCLFCGEWRVYHNEEQARRLFCRFKACKRALLKRVETGRTLAQIFCAA